MLELVSITKCKKYFDLNRRDFIKTSIALAGSSNLPFITYSQLIDSQELLGLRKPLLVGSKHMLRKQAHLDFMRMKKEARKAGIIIQAVSSYRSFNRQKSIWNKKYNQLINQGLSKEASIHRILEYSTLPGTSRHHWGTEIDIVDATKPFPKEILIQKNYETHGVYHSLKCWMDEHSQKYNWMLTYPNETKRTGFSYEPWHYSYQPLSQAYLSKFLKIDLDDFYLNRKDINGFEMLSADLLNQYVKTHILGVNELLLPD